jgi:tetratricopeptide (TPR) repeat protein
MHWLIVLTSYAMFMYLLVYFISRWEHVFVLVGAVVVMATVEGLLSGIQLDKGSTRPSGTFFNPNFLAGYMAAAWTVLLAYMSFQPIRRYRLQGCQSRSWAQITGIGLPLSILLGLTLSIIWTGSRGGMLAAGVGASIVTLARFGWRGLLLLFSLCLVGLTLIPNPFVNRVIAEHTMNAVTYARWEMWESAIQITMDHPLGIGLGLYQYVFPQFAFPVESQIARYGTLAQTPHNEYVQIAVEVGILGLVIFGWGIFRIAQLIRNVLSQRLARRQRYLLVGVAGAIGGLLAHAAVDSNLHEPALAIVLTLCVSIVVSSDKLLAKRLDSATIRPIRHRPVWTVAAVVAIAMLLVVVLRIGIAWLYYETGNGFNRAGDLAVAMKQYETAMEIDPGKSLYHSAVASVWFRQFEQGRDLKAAQTAVDHLHKAVALNPLDGRLHRLLGHVYMRMAMLSGMGQEQKRSLLVSSQEAYRKAMTQEPFNAAYYWEAGQVHLQLGDGQTAQGLITRAVEIEPNFLRGREWLSKWYWDRGQVDQAYMEYKEIKSRQERYRGWEKTLLEREYLSADVDGLAARLNVTGGNR